MSGAMRATAALTGLMLLGACEPDGPGNTLAADPVASGQASVDTLTGIGEGDEPGTGLEPPGGDDVQGSDM
jgi:hypothetical protein